MKKQIEDISVKVMDFDVFDLFKESSVGGGSVDATKILIKNLEQKIQHKTEIIDEKLKKNEEDIYKLKNEFQNLKNESDVITHNLNNFQDKIKELVEQVSVTNDYNSNLVNEINGKLTETYKKLLQKIEEEKNELKKSIDKIKKQLKQITNKENGDENKEKLGNHGLSDDDLKLISDLTKRMNEAEKNLKNVITVSSEILRLKERILKLDNNLTTKTNQIDFEQCLNKLENQINMSNNIRDLVDKVQDMASKNMKDLSYFLNKIESLSATVLAMKEALETLSGMKQENIFDMTQYVENIAFQEFIKKTNKDKNNLEKNIDELRRLFKDILESFNKKADEKDLRDFELLLNNKLEELKLMSGKKFADKIDTGKTLKYLDAQIKFLSENFNKKNDRNDNWLLAKKPLYGHSCASCESYLGNLKESDDYIPWNKYPQRERDKNYRVGNGFSRMLNMLNLDVKNTFEGIKENNYDSDNNSEHMNFDKKRLMTSPVNNSINTNNNSKINNYNRSTLNNFGQSNLPKINMTLNKEEGISNFNMSSYQMTNKSLQEKNKKDKNQPNIVKIYKK
jgi:chromosome segregation ATPase